MKKRILNLIVLTNFLLFIGCAKSGPVQLNVMTHDNFAVSDAVIKEFEKTNDVKVNFILSGDAGSALNQAILTKASPIADVFYGVDNTFLSRALAANIYESYSSPMLINVPDQFQLDKNHFALPVDFGDVCINYDKTYFAEKKLGIPQTLDDLLKPEYRGVAVMT